MRFYLLYKLATFLLGSPRPFWRVLRYGLIASLGASATASFGLPEPMAITLMVLLFVSLMNWGW